MPKEDVNAREAKQGEKMIEIKVRFWTDSIADKGKIIPKHGLTSGVIRIARNRSHDIEPEILSHSTHCWTSA